MRALSTEMGPQRTDLQGRSLASGRPTRAVIDLAALEHNFKEVIHHARGRQVLAVVKAGAYGHGAVEVSRRLLSLGADMLGVALVEEGRELRKAGIDAPILIMGAIFPEQAEAIVELSLTPVVFSLPVAQAFSAAEKRKKQSRCTLRSIPA